MKIIHQADNDGLCAAAIIGTEFSNPFSPIKSNDYIVYDNECNIDDSIDITPDEKIYIIGITLEESIYNFIIKIIKMGGNIIHIDHHIDSTHFYESLSSNDIIKTNQHYKHLFRNDICTGLLVWVYCHMSDYDKERCDVISFDFENNWNHFMIHNTEYLIPPVLRYINDKVIQMNYFRETDDFIEGLSIEEDLSVRSAIWTQLLYNWSARIISDYIKRGQIVRRYLKKLYIRDMKNSYESNILSPYSMICINSPSRNLNIFKDVFDPIGENDTNKKNYDIGCLYNYDGKNDIWNYVFYINSNDPKIYDVISDKIIKNFRINNDSVIEFCLDHMIFRNDK